MDKKQAAIATVAGLATTLTSWAGSGAWAADVKPNPFLPAVPFSANMEPAIPHPKQQAEATSKLDALEKRFGRKPNILIIVVDDMGWGDPGCYGGGDAIGAPTPNMDRLANQGLRLTSCYSQPMSTPTRASLMTGRLPARTGLIRPIMAGEKLTRNPWSDEQTAAKILDNAGYATALSGKWHLGEGKGLEPQDNGYDEFYGFLVVTAEYTPPWDVRRYPELVNHPMLREAYLHKGFDNHIIHARKGGYRKNVKLLDLEGIANCDQDFLKFSEDFIRRQAKENNPFYLIHATAKVHYDNWPAKGYQGKSPGATPYKDAIVEVDDIIGSLIKVLEETGQAENTFVFVTSDNGPEESAYYDCGMTPFRGAKGHTWEGGIRIPGIAYWPGVIKGGRVSDGMFDLMDLFNTSLTMGGVSWQKLPRDRYYDGVDQTSFLLSDTGESNRQTVFMWNQYDFMALRWREFKAHLKINAVDNMSYSSNGGWQNSLVIDTLYPWTYSLYRDPKERYPAQGGQFEWTIVPMDLEGERHMLSFKKFPPKKIGLELP